MLRREMNVRSMRAAIIILLLLLLLAHALLLATRQRATSGRGPEVNRIPQDLTSAQGSGYVDLGRAATPAERPL